MTCEFTVYGNFHVKIQYRCVIFFRQKSQDYLAISDSDESPTEDKIINKFCDVCKFSEKEVDAPRYCVECTKLLCVDCAARHRETSVSNQHRIISSNKTVPKEMSCKKHPPEPLSIYCKTCVEPVCMTCTMTSDHENHDLVKVEEECSAIATELAELLNACKERVPEIRATLTFFNDMERSVKKKEKNVHRNLRSKFIKNICKMQVRV